MANTTLTIKYNRPQFFGGTTYAEDKCWYPLKKDILKAFRHMKKEKDTALECDTNELSYIVFFDKTVEYENDVVTLRVFNHGSYDEKKLSFDKAKKLFVEIVENGENEVA